jgi:deoxyribodipyrimidine photo-lyase
MNQQKLSGITVFWFRRDLRLHDNGGLYHALKSGLPVLPIFIFDTTILERLTDKQDARVQFIHDALVELNAQLEKLGSKLSVWHGKPSEVWKEIGEMYSVKNIFTNRDYEPAARKRDQEIGAFLEAQGIKFFLCKDQCLFERSEVLKDDGLPYTVFTPYKNKYRAKLNAFYLKSYPTEKYADQFLAAAAIENRPIPDLQTMGFEALAISFPLKTVRNELLKNYATKRDLPAVSGTSRLSVHLRFGTVSIRQLAQQAFTLSDVWMNELIWRDFYMMIVWHFPHVATNSFRREYDNIVWRTDESDFNAWCAGKTGYPLVDAGMRELNATGFMHNRVRMVVASFLTKHLLLDWRWGEAYFAQKLLDFDLSANNGGWQWAAGTGTDAAPYFRIFNPSEQQKKFDPDFVYIKKWVPEFGTVNYPKPIVDHVLARERCLRTYKVGLGKN